MALLTRIEPQKNMNRWYRVSIQRSLFEPWVVVCSWGRRDSGYARMRVLAASSSEDAKAKASQVIARKLQRGYKVSVVKYGQEDRLISVAALRKNT
jgi:predicted DNA-binding WGR domain protein